MTLAALADLYEENIALDDETQEMLMIEIAALQEEGQPVSINAALNQLLREALDAREHSPKI